MPITSSVLMMGSLRSADFKAVPATCLLALSISLFSAVELCQTYSKHIFISLC